MMVKPDIEQKKKGYLCLVLCLRFILMSTFRIFGFGGAAPI
jgi:hypothetical protein